MVRWQKAGCVIVCVLCGAVCAAFFAPEKAERVAVALCETRLVSNNLRVSGVLTRQGLTTALPPAALPVEAVYVREGESVKAGQALYKLDSSQLEAQLSAAMAQRALVAEVMGGQAASYAAQIELLEKQIGACVVRAQTGGQVIKVELAVGQIAQGGAILAEGGASVRALIPDGRIGEVKTGSAVTVSRDGKNYPGVLESYEASKSSEGYFEAVIKLSAQPPYPLGSAMQPDILVGQVMAAAVPLEALYIHEDAVLCAIDGYAVKAPITVLEQDATHAAVSGLPEGVYVILYPDDIAEGARVDHEGA